MIFQKKDIYLDHASSTPIDRRVTKVMHEFERKHFANPSALHKKGVESRNAIAQARRDIAALLHVRPEEIIFTSGGTESDNSGVLGVVRGAERAQKHVITSSIEHSAVLEACKKLESEGVRITYIDPEENGIVDPKKIAAALTKETVLVSVQYANNEIGTVQPIGEIVKVLRHFKKENNSSMYPLFHTDAAQAVNYLSVNLQKLNVDLISFNGTKIYGPRGIGVLYIKKGIHIEPLVYGGPQEQGIRAGTENGPAIVGLAEALLITERIKEKESARLRDIQSYALSRLQDEFPTVHLNGDREERLPNNINISVPNIPSELLVLELDARRIYVSARSACKSGDSESHVVQALAPQNTGEEGTIRISMGRDTVKSDIDTFLNALQYIISKLDPWYN